MALLVAIEGIDGSGKGTQAARLQQSLNESGRPAALISFPRYDQTAFGRKIGDFLNGRFGRLDEVNPFLVSLLYAGDRFESKGVLHEAMQNHEVVIIDRYVPSNIAHQGAKLGGSERDEIIDWIEQVEYGIYALPRPDLVVLLDLPATTAQQLIARKSARTYTDQAADLHEADCAYLAGVRDLYCQLAARDAQWQKIDVESDGTLRPIDEIATQLHELIASRLAAGEQNPV
ncbi:Thymidylate kinase [Maioricimonas rarisocia]|uniref:Thymidylate kinase n=1 Tax=Maioricimonas rarisocia TaxID=2528026 RepID=A0A517Z368_9PLAN|nr:thymidylate kinase [Maioricimonas rarisocia]QDU36867.1 Thymidylate kinase [Maioricimonas rarisocia]